MTLKTLKRLQKQNFCSFASLVDYILLARATKRFMNGYVQVAQKALNKVYTPEQEQV
ncbi:hypothetical protein [Helicobacter mehlei]|uniref:hypothetical protein n=1 Tax=Helicobacter mehlei TaxID=2316080 RepID=UPI0013CE1F37|nr:hypothetical protein [Helicobacter mehlei]